MVRVELDSPAPEVPVSMDEEDLSMEYVSVAELSYSDFFVKFLLANKPCVVRQVSDGWKCQTQWVVDGKPNFPLLLEKFGDREVPTANCKEEYFNSHLKVNMKLSEYIDYWQSYREANYPSTRPLLYLKDWHCLKECEEEELYRVPEYFVSDWLNEYYLTSAEDDYRFVYMGPKGTWTGLHTDVFGSFSWSVNLCGQKEWVFFPASEVHSLTDSLGHMVTDLSPYIALYSKDGGSLGGPDIAATNLPTLWNQRFPRLGSARRLSLHQGPGDAVFVPSGWYHQVWNREDTISVNHNWVNGANVHLMLANLLRDLDKVETELSDCVDSQSYPADCQTLLEATFGLNIPQFLHFVEVLVSRRIEAAGRCDLTLPSGDSIGPCHILYDLASLRKVLITLSALRYDCLDTATISTLTQQIDAVLNPG